MDGIREFILYRNLDDSNLFSRFVALMAHTKKDCKKKEKMSKCFIIERIMAKFVKI